MEKALNVPGVSKSAIFREYGLMFENQGNLNHAIEAYKKALQLSTNPNEHDGYKAAVRRCEDKIAFANPSAVNPAPAPTPVDPATMQTPPMPAAPVQAPPAPPMV